MNIEHSPASIFQYSFNIEINRSAQKVWSVIFDSIDQWWMADFRALGESSVMQFNVENGSGALLEKTNQGATLEWYRVQMIVPGEAIYLTGYLAPDWGGPTTSMLKLSLEERGDKCVLSVSDALLGNVSESKAQNAQEGWKLLFGEGLKPCAEAA